MKKLSLQDQLLKAGLSNKSKAQQVNKQKQKQKKQQNNNKTKVLDESAVLANQAKQAQREKDRLLNQQRHADAEKKQLAAQIAQLINLNKLEKTEEGTAFNFTDNSKVKTLVVTDDTRDSLISGRLVVVSLGADYEIVPAAVADKIAQRDAQRVFYVGDAKSQTVDDDYADYVIPDDLMW